MRSRLGISLLTCLVFSPLHAQERKAPEDLRPLLTERPSRMQLVAQRYTIDREQLDRFYATPLSSTHLARVKRFDLQWLAAVKEIDAGDFAAEERRDLEQLLITIHKNVESLHETSATFATTRPHVPFAAAIEELLENRRKVAPMDARKSAGVIAGVTARIKSLTADVESGKVAILGKETGTRAADAVRDIRRAARDWFRFYNGYDPMFSWWMAKPYEQFGAAMDAYAGVLRAETEGLAGEPGAKRTKRAKPDSPELAAAAPPKHSYVPDLATLLAVPHNEMIGVLRAFRGGGRGQGRGNRGRGRGRRGPRRAPPTEEFYEEWQLALSKLDFAKLSRPAQVSYLGLRAKIAVGVQRLVTPKQENIPHKKDASGITGRPIGRTALELSLADEIIPYTPEELIAIGDTEYAWCMDEMLKASRELGFKDDWRAALEHVKTLHVEPGGQPLVIRKLMFEAADFLREHDLITVPQVAAETLTMIMMTPARQLVNPFFTGGNQISVSFPTDTMAHHAKLQSLRGNNVPFSRATVHHELIPGHNLQYFYDRRFRSVQAGWPRTPFHLEGWAVYFEMILYRMGFPAIAAKRAGGPKDAENRIGFLFWRMHRSARITFSLRFHMGLWSAQQCIDFLVDGVGHERENAIAEVRRSFAGGYSPLYQAGYLLGAVQFRKLNEELVGSGKMKARAFHDAIQRAGTMPVALVRLLLNGEELAPEMPLAWKFYGEKIPTKRK